MARTQLFKSPLILTSLIYLVIIVVLSIPAVNWLKSLHQANQSYQQKLHSFLNWTIGGDKVSFPSGHCQGQLFYSTHSPISTLVVFKDKLYLAQEKQLTVVDLKDPSSITQIKTPLLSNFYASSDTLLATDLTNDAIVQVDITQSNPIQKLSDKLGHPGAITSDGSALFVSGYASGVVTKIMGRDRYFKASHLDQAAGMAFKDDSLYLAKYNSSPSLVKITNHTSQIVDSTHSFSDLHNDNQNLWTVYQDGPNSQLAQIKDDKLIPNQTLNCSFPTRIAISSDKIFYVSMADPDGGIYLIDRTLQIKGR